MSSEPKIGGREPVLVELVAGETYWWCRCGRSQTQPFCDGSHEGTGIEPLEWKVEATGGPCCAPASAPRPLRSATTAT